MTDTPNELSLELEDLENQLAGLNKRRRSIYERSLADTPKGGA